MSGKELARLIEDFNFCAKEMRSLYPPEELVIQATPEFRDLVRTKKELLSCVFEQIFYGVQFECCPNLDTPFAITRKGAKR